MICKFLRYNSEFFFLNTAKVVKVYSTHKNGIYLSWRWEELYKTFLQHHWRIQRQEIFIGEWQNDWKSRIWCYESNHKILFLFAINGRCCHFLKIERWGSQFYFVNQSCLLTNQCYLRMSIIIKLVINERSKNFRSHNLCKI